MVDRPGGTVLLSERLAQAFALGAVRQPLVRAASGWGGHNQVFRLETASGTWAVKRHGRPGIAPSTATVAIETAAFAGGVPMPRPALTADGRCWVQIDGLPYRCHEWIDGTTKENEVTSATEAEAMGRIVAHLHGLAIEVSQPDRPDGPDLEGILEPVVAAANGTEALMCLVDAHAVFERRIAAIALVAESARRAAPEMDALVAGRMAIRHGAVREIVARVGTKGEFRPVGASMTPLDSCGHCSRPLAIGCSSSMRSR